MTKQEIEAIKERCEAATPGPWAHEEYGFGIKAITRNLYFAFGCDEQVFRDMEFTSHAREDMIAYRIDTFLSGSKPVACSNVAEKTSEYILGIKSPSTVFAGIGGNMAAGLGKGFTDSMRSVVRDINNSIPTNLDMPNGAYPSVPRPVGSGPAASPAQPITRTPIVIQLTQTLEGRPLVKGMYNFILEESELRGVNLVRG